MNPIYSECLEKGKQFIVSVVVKKGSHYGTGHETSLRGEVFKHKLSFPSLWARVTSEIPELFAKRDLCHQICTKNDNSNSSSAKTHDFSQERTVFRQLSFLL